MKLVQKLSVSIPQPGSAAGATGHMGLAFAARQLENPRPATRKKAEKLLKRWAAKLT